MFNTLKEIEDALSYENLCKYTDEVMGKSKEEIKEILKSHNIEASDFAVDECYDYIKDITAISEEELENVAGGSCYSSDTFASLGFDPSLFYGQQSHYHPLITTIGNSCKLKEGGSTCLSCRHLFKPSDSATCYCNARSKECDPGK